MPQKKQALDTLPNNISIPCMCGTHIIIMYVYLYIQLKCSVSGQLSDGMNYRTNFYALKLA